MDGDVSADALLKDEVFGVSKNSDTNQNGGLRVELVLGNFAISIAVVDVHRLVGHFFVCEAGEVFGHFDVLFACHNFFSLIVENPKSFVYLFGFRRQRYDKDFDYPTL